MFSRRNSTRSSSLEINLKNITNYIRLFFIIIIHFLITLFLNPINYINTILWNNGVCRKCNYGKYISDFRPDRFVNNQFYCECCKHRFYSSVSREVISEEDWRIVIRNKKIKQIVE